MKTLRLEETLYMTEKMEYYLSKGFDRKTAGYYAPETGNKALWTSFAGSPETYLADFNNYIAVCGAREDSTL